MLRLLEESDVNAFARQGGSTFCGRGRYFGLEDAALARLIRRGWVISEVRDFFVVPEKRRQGYGRKLLQLLLQKALTPVVFLTVRLDNEPMRKIVEEEGFRNTGTISSPAGNEVIFYAYHKRG